MYNKKLKLFIFNQEVVLPIYGTIVLIFNYPIQYYCYGNQIPLTFITGYPKLLTDYNNTLCIAFSQVLGANRSTIGFCLFIDLFCFFIIFASGQPKKASNNDHSFKVHRPILRICVGLLQDMFCGLEKNTFVINSIQPTFLIISYTR